MRHVILLTEGHEASPPVLPELLRAAGVSVCVVNLTTTAETNYLPSPSERAAHADGAGDISSPFAVLCEIGDNADAARLRAQVARAAERWPEALLVACRRTPQGKAHAARQAAHGLDHALLLRLGFCSVADDPAQAPALLRELEDSGSTAHDVPAVPSPTPPDPAPNNEPVRSSLPQRLGVRHLRAAFEAVAALHFVSEQKGAAQTALVKLAPLVSADRWTIYLTSEARGAGHSVTFEPLATHSVSADAGEPPPEDRRRTLDDSLSPPAGEESRAARAAHAEAETLRRTEGGRRVLATPLIGGERVLGVLEAVRDAANAKGFSAREAALIDALAVPLSAALANAVRIAEAEHLSQTDDLTKLHNARFLRQYLTAEIRRARRYNSTVAAIFLDLDDFKEINDRYGHLVGSHVLMEIATVILTGVRDTDVVSRYGGDEFVVVLPETASGQATFVAERMREKIDANVFNGGRGLRLHLTASIGVASFPHNSQSPQQLIADADAAMYEAKAARKNCVRFAGDPKP